MYLSQEQNEQFDKLRKIARVRFCKNLLVNLYPKVLFAIIFVVIVSCLISSSFIGLLEDTLNSLLDEAGDRVFILCFVGVFLAPVLINAVMSLLIFLYSRYGLKITSEDETSIANCAITSVISSLYGYGVKLNEGFSDSLKDKIENLFFGCDTRAISKSSGFTLNEDLYSKIAKTDCESGFLRFSRVGRKDYCHICRSSTKRLHISHNSDGHRRTHRFYETWYFCELEGSVPSHITIGTSGFVPKRGSTAISPEGSKKKFRVRGEFADAKKYLTSEKLDELLSLSNRIKDGFCIELIENYALVIVNRKSSNDVFNIKHNDTVDTYVERLQNEVDKMSAMVDYFSK